METKEISASWGQVRTIPNTIIPDKERLQSILERANKVADFGPCYGKTIELIQELTPNCTVHGYDFNPQAIQALHERFNDNKNIHIHQTNLLNGKIEKGHDAITAVGFVSCFRKKAMINLFKNINRQIEAGTTLAIIDFPYLPKVKQAHYQRGLEQGLPRGSFRALKRNNLEVTHLNITAIQSFLEKKGYDILISEIVEQEKLVSSGVKENHSVLYLIAKKKIATR